MNEVLESRQYRCLGQWHENNLLYTYTERIDLGQHKIFECFVGYQDSDTVIHIKEAGKHCQRHENLHLYKMQLTKTGILNFIIIDLQTFVWILKIFARRTK